MCVQYRGGGGGRRENIMSTVGVCSTIGRYHDTSGGISKCGDIMIHEGGYHEYRGACSVLRKQKMIPPHGTEHSLQYTFIMISLHGTQDTSLHGTQDTCPHGTHNIPSWYSLYPP